MSEVLLFIIVALQGIVIILWLRPKRGNKQTEAFLKDDIDKLNDSVVSMREQLSEKLSDRLEKNQAMMLKSFQKQFSESAKLISNVSSSLSELKESNKQVVSVTDELKLLQNTLQNPKQRGVLGEYYLQTVLQNVLPPERFAMQYKFKDGETVDAVIYLDKQKILPIDSKFSLENYNRLVESKSKTERQNLEKAFKADLKLRIDETAKYIRPDEDTMEFAFMFIPSEAIYYDLLINKVGETNTSSRDLIEYAFRDKNVIVVSPTSFMAYLQTVLQGLRSLQIEEQAKEIQKQVGKLGNHISAYEQFMKKLGGSLGTTVNHYNSAYKELNKIDKDVVKISETAPSIEPELVDRPTED